MSKRVLMIAFHFPPWQGSSGVQRTLKFCRYLPEHGWDPLVLSVHPHAYQSVSLNQLSELPPHVKVERAFGLDAAKHLSVAGIYPACLAWPDRWSSWWVGAVPAGLKLIRRYRPDLIWSTFPIATAHMIGLTLHRFSRIPWVADFRDSMTEDHYPADPKVRRIYRWIERHTIARCRRAVFTTPGALRMYRDRYPAVEAVRWAVIGNGYDEENFLSAQRAAGLAERVGGPIVLVHSGVLYPSERDPRAFFSALRNMKAAGRISSQQVKIVLRATGHDDHYRELLAQLGLGDIVSIEPPIPYQEALIEMLRADGLLVFQASNCNHQVPAKVYEYLRAGRPILALTDPNGDTAAVLKQAGIDTIVPLDAENQIVVGLADFLTRLRASSAPVPRPGTIEAFSRRAKTRELAGLFEAVESE
jgi:glycosyltransferase involved in cell wall biosynthesis